MKNNIKVIMNRIFIDILEQFIEGEILNYNRIIDLMNFMESVVYNLNEVFCLCVLYGRIWLKYMVKIVIKLYICRNIVESKINLRI